MATSNSTNFSITRDEIITVALRKIGAISQGESPTTAQISEAAIVLNLLVKAWQATGMPLWALKTSSIPLVASTTMYRIGLGQTVNLPKPLKIIQAWTRDTTSNIDIPLRILTRQEYNILGNKSSSGDVIQLYYDVQNEYGDLYVFPTPSSADTLYIVYQRPFEDFDSSSDTPDFPQEWYDAVVYGLAARLAPEYGISIEDRRELKKEAKEVKDEALSFGTEEGSIYFGIENRGW